MRELIIEAIDRKKLRIEEEVNVFLGGPYLDPDISPDANEAGGAALLRFKLYHAIRSLGCDVSIGESKDLERLYKEDLKSLFEAATMEIAHVTDHRDAVVIIPSSPGSFCELGYFSASDAVCSKMLILLSKEHDLTPGYVHYGPSNQARNAGSIVESVDYRDYDAVSLIVFGFIENIKTKKIASRYRLGSRR